MINVTRKPNNSIYNQLSPEEYVDILRKYAHNHGFQLNPHNQTLSRLAKELTEIREETGYPYCPCRKNDITGDLFIDKKIICPCAYHLGEIKNNGFCKCELFVRKFSGLPSLISTSIHRSTISEVFDGKSNLSLIFHLSDRYEGDVRIYIPNNWDVLDIAIEKVTMRDFRIEDNILVIPVRFNKSIGEINIKFRKIY